MIPVTPSVSCDAETKWNFGDRFMTYLKTTKTTGLTGHIEFDEKTGLRKNLTIHIVDLIKNGLSLVT